MSTVQPQIPISERRMSRGEQEQRKQRVLTHGTPSVVSSIADAVVSKEGSLFMLTDRNGSVPASERHGFGLYHNDCRYLRAYELRLAGRTLNPLVPPLPRGTAQRSN